MLVVVCRFLVLCALSAPISAFAATNFTPPTPEELKMTSDPAAPGAAAVYLFREETADDRRGMHTLYARIKILTAAGREKFSDITIPYEDREENIRGVEARTIHSDGTVIPFTGKPWQKELVKAGGVKLMEKGFSMPDVQVGSILEYRYEMSYDQWWAPHWHVQESVPVHRAHYHFTPGLTGHVASVRFLPAEAQITENDKGWDLVLNNVPPAAEEDNAPPSQALGFRVLFYYVSPDIDTVDKYWQQEGDVWSAGVEEYVAVNKLKSVVGQIVAPGDSDDQKLHKIYAAVMKIENLDNTREHTEKENKAEKLKFRNAADIWQQQRGYNREITMVFLGLVRAAGLKAYAMIVTSRDRRIFIKGELDWDQLDDEIVIVNVAGKEMYFDPGMRYCEYGQLPWKDTWTTGVRQTEKGTALAETPAPNFKDNRVSRGADLELGEDGTLKGVIRITMRGAEALRWRQAALLSDERQVTKDFEAELQARVPDGVEVKMNHFVGLTDNSSDLMAVVDVSGHMGTRTGKRLFLPGAFFEAREKPPFAEEKRENPVDLHYPFLLADKVNLKLPAGVAVETVPSDVEIPMGHSADYRVHYKSGDGAYTQDRAIAMGAPIYKVAEYPQLREFFQKVSTQDQVQLVLKVTAAEHGAAADSVKSE